MHSMILVIGDDPIGQLTDVFSEKEWTRTESTAEGHDHPRHAGEEGYGQNIGVDWCGIGGRYSGMLLLKPGAGGTRYGDAPLLLEAWLGANVPSGADLTRHGARGDRAGVDKARAGDVDWDSTIAAADRKPRAVVAGGKWHDMFEVLTDEERAALLVSSLMPHEEMNEQRREEASRAMAAAARWYDETLGPLMDEADARNDLVTVVDIHE